MKRIIYTKEAPYQIGPYSQAVEINGTLFISGQIPLDPATSKLVEGGIREQTGQVMKNIGAILKAAGYSFEDVVKSTVLLTEMGHFPEMNEVYGKFFTDKPPARATYGASKLPMGAMIEIEALAMKSDEVTK